MLGVKRAWYFLSKNSSISLSCSNFCRYYSSKEIKRFYKNVSIAKGEGGFEVNLDKHKLKTPMGKVFCVQNEALALGVANEWESQQGVIKKSTMHLTHLSNSALDNPTMRSKDTVINGIIEFLSTDTICYRVDEPDELASLQKSEWDPLLNWFCRRYGVHLMATSGLGVPVVPDATKEAFRTHLNSYSSSALVGYQEAVDCTKSVIISTALMNREISVERAVQLARLELEYQIGRWGNVEWHHDVDKLELRSRLAAAAIFVYLNTHESKTVFDKHAVV